MNESKPFELHPKLASGCFLLERLRGCRVLLKNQSLFPWLLVVPEVAEGMEDLHQLEAERYHEVMAVVRDTSEFVSAHFGWEKLNVACIGNQVRQMHIHVVARRSDDPAWPGTVWAHAGKEAYEPGRVEEIRRAWLAWRAGA